MIAHVSISVQRPDATAALLARLMDGVVAPFAPAPGACAVVVLDGQGTMIEVLPAGTVIEPGVGEARPGVAAYPQPWAAQFVQQAPAASAAPFHVAIATRRSTEEVLAAGREAGLRTLVCERGGLFDVVEMWLDDRLMIEWLVPEQAARYRAMFTLEAFDAAMARVAAMRDGGSAAAPMPAEPALAG